MSPEWLRLHEACKKIGAKGMKSFLSECIYYPASGYDGTPVRHLSKRWNRFVYADAWGTREQQLGALQSAPFLGYQVANQRAVSPAELIPEGWTPRPPRWLTPDSYLRDCPLGRMRPAGWAQLSHLDREAGFSSEHGPSSFELLQIQAEGAACYQALFNSNGILPAAVVYIRAGEGFGGNFSDYSKAMLDVMLDHPLGLPPFLFCWHQNGRPSVSEHWCKHYRDIVLGPFGKDGEAWFQVSLFARIGLCPEGALPPLLR